MAVITQSGRAAIAYSVKSQTLHIAWGTGRDEWGNPPPPTDGMTDALVTEIGRRVVDSAVFCTPDEDGEIVVSTGRFTASAVPTNNLFIHVRYDFTDGGTATIKELGLFTGTVIKAGTPVGQKYYLPDDIDDPGILMLYENTVPLIRTGATRENFSFVATF